MKIRLVFATKNWLFNLIVLLSFVLSLSSADAQNPYASLGVEVNMLTLSQGKYEEFIKSDTVVQIGTALLNTITGKVVGFVSPEMVTHTLNATLSSRFLSIDPITRLYPELTPYQFASNRPIDGIDLDGLEFKPARIKQEKFRRTITFDAEIKVVNHTTNLSAGDVKQYIDEAQKAINETFLQSYGSLKFEMNVALVPAEKANEDEDFFIELVDIARSPNTGQALAGHAYSFPGNTQIGKIVISTQMPDGRGGARDKVKFKSFTDKSTVNFFNEIIGVTIHELGHKATGMNHIETFPELLKTSLGNNFLLEGPKLNASKYNEWEILIDQYMRILENVVEQAGFIIEGPLEPLPPPPSPPANEENKKQTENNNDENDQNK